MPRSTSFQRKYAPEYLALKSIFPQDTSYWALVDQATFTERHIRFTSGSKPQHRALQCVALVDEGELSRFDLPNAFSEVDSLTNLALVDSIGP